MDSLRKLEEIFAHFPGIGPRQAKRFVYYLLGKPQTFTKEFAQLVEAVKKSARECENCHRLFIVDLKKDKIAGVNSRERCRICVDQSRDHSTLMIISRDSDLESIEKSGVYQGLYFVLGGTIPILDKEPEKRIRLKLLLERVSNSPEIKEIILSLNATPDGEHTTDIVKESIAKIIDHKLAKVTILGRGLSTGAELEYADSDTIKNALKHRE